ncbi:Lrp/AsnC family transcriptional regulator [Hoyosella subflava]|uniref:Transcriptional regulator, AsnC family n=1 Tax=Hoyosella subflava (strain DSM 45089 / JCM 17490 / NBRC 109087 / DQS3-9A1) TaxID=443218 RepID=F6EQC6_HOYSD|nr:Lrp/AsnC family transcriptional regulator [Hoyosella subflava]AEF40611.1 Transcriptional regulator, AsnC family [Hoyosella subflava DQS3-9A1]
MDAVDRKILAELQMNGRISITELASRVRLTVSPTHRRLRDLEESGVIRGYRAALDPEALGLKFEALLFITMREANHETLVRFEEAAAAIPNVLEAQRLFGEPDYLVRVVSEDLADYQRLYDEQLTRLPGVQRVASTLVMKHVVRERPLPL